MRPLLSFLCVVMLTSCTGVGAPAYVRLPDQHADASFRKLVMTFTDGGAQRTEVPFFLKLFPAGDKVAVCGYYVPNGSAYSDMTLAKWVEGATIYAGERPIVTASFLYAKAPRPTERDADATCVRSEVGFQPGVERGSLSLRGERVTARY